VEVRMETAKENVAEVKMRHGMKACLDISPKLMFLGKYCSTLLLLEHTVGRHIETEKETCCCNGSNDIEM